MSATDPFSASTIVDTALGPRRIWRLDALRSVPGQRLDQAPCCIRVLLEAALRHCDGQVYTEEAVRALATYDAARVGEQEIPFMPGRVVLQDFTGVPAVVDLAAMRWAIVRLTGDPSAAAKVNPLVPCDLVIDHSVQVDAFGSGMALAINSQKEFERNAERYELLKWAQQAFANFRVVPPATGIVHQVNLEYLAQVVWDGGAAGGAGGAAAALYPDSLVGTDSHTTMINGLGVLGWGVGGIEAEAVMLGQPISMLIPEVVGVRVAGRLPEGATSTDLVLRVTQMLRKLGVVGRFVEFFGPGLAGMPLATRATVANMAPEYGATIGFFPVDEQTLRYLALTGRDPRHIQAVEQYCRMQGLWPDEGRPASYSRTVELDLASIEPSLAGPKRPQDRVPLARMKSAWHRELADTYDKAPAAGVSTVSDGTDWNGEGGRPELAAAAATADAARDGVSVDHGGHRFLLRHGAVVIAAITSCTNTSNPQVMVAAGLVARKARQRGLERKPWVKTSLAPGSTVVTEYLAASGLGRDLDALGFHLVGYGCTTCIGNSGPLPEPISRAIAEHDVVAVAVLSGNRNFEGRINPDVKANYLASPPLVVAYAIAGTVDIDLAREPLGLDGAGRPVFLRDLWPSASEIEQVVATVLGRDQFVRQYAQVFRGCDRWQAVRSPSGALYQWDPLSTYVQEPPFFAELAPHPSPIRPIVGARCLAKLGDSVTTDHISPAGSIKADSPAGRHLLEQGVPVSMFNSYGSRRGNDRVMTRGTFANIRVRNQLAPGTEGGLTVYLGPAGAGSDPGVGAVLSIHEAALKYREHGVPLLVLAGRDYGMGSSRDWAAKGTFLLGVRAVLAESFERIHRSNLVGMGVLPLCYRPGSNAASLGLDGTETFAIGVDDRLEPRQEITVTATRRDGSTLAIPTVCRIDTPVEVTYYRHGGILPAVLRRMAGTVECRP